MKLTSPTPEKEALELAKRFFELGRQIEAIPGRYRQAVNEMLARIDKLEATPSGVTRSQALDQAYALRAMIGTLGSVMESFPESIFYKLDKLLASATSASNLEDRLQKQLDKVENLFEQARELMVLAK